jgi:hypothetical protein
MKYVKTEYGLVKFESSKFLYKSNIEVCRPDERFLPVWFRMQPKTNA